ncbi:hypothetical protein T492DRAFT_301491 [Pavlovales sp. CCMP2436]|nr:hypothetical protein T492DRAFT_301491 [Pavlovales sp. CCMP2436]
MLGYLLVFALARTAAQNVRTLELGGSVTAELGRQSVALYRIAVPADCDSFTLQLSGCPARSPSSASGIVERGADNVKAFLSFTTTRPTVWESQWSVNWCAPALVFERGQPGFPAAAGSSNGTAVAGVNSTAVLHVSVFAAVQARATLVAWRGASELRFGQRLVQQMVMHGVEGPSPDGRAAPRAQTPPSVYLQALLPPKVVNTFISSSSYSRRVEASIAVAAGTFSVRIPPTSQAIAVRLALKNATSYPNSESRPRGVPYGESDGNPFADRMCDLAVSLSLTATNLTAFPASWAMHAVASGAEQELIIPRTSRAFCRAEPCVLTIQLFAPPSLHQYIVRRSYNPTSRVQTSDYFMCFSPTLDTASHRIEIDVSDAAPPAVDPANYEISKNAAARSVSIEPRGQLAAATCAPGCEQDFVNDGVCHESCVTPACRDDGGDCDADGGGTYPFCATGCRNEWLGDGVCDDACFVRECGWDNRDCSKAVRLERYVAAAAQPESRADDDAVPQLP